MRNLEPVLENWGTQVRKGLLELCILNAIAGGRCYGYDIVKTLRAADGLLIGEGTIYPILSRFRALKLVDASIEESAEGPPRKNYRLTAQGRQCLNEMNAAWNRVQNAVDQLRSEKPP